MCVGLSSIIALPSLKLPCILVFDDIFSSILLALPLSSLLCNISHLLKLNWQCMVLITAVQLEDLQLKSIDLITSRLRGRTHLQSLDLLLNHLVGLRMNRRLRREMKSRSLMMSSERCLLRSNVLVGHKFLVYGARQILLKLYDRAVGHILLCRQFYHFTSLLISISKGLVAH